MPYTRPGGVKNGSATLPPHLQLKKREQSTDDNTPTDYIGAVGKSGSILTKGLLPKTPKAARLGQLSVVFDPTPTIDTYIPRTPLSSEKGGSDDEQLDTPDGLDSFELSPKETESAETEPAASGSKQAEEPTKAALALLEASQSEAQTNRPGLSAHRQKQLAKKAKAEKTE